MRILGSSVFLATLLWASASGIAAPAPVLLSDTFADPALPGWAVHASQGNEVTAGGGRLHIRARTHTYAHLSRPAPGQPFAAVTSVRALSGDQGLSWCPSLMVYWDADNWAKIGLDDRNAVHVLCVVGGYHNETLDLVAQPGQEVGIGIEVAGDGLRFRARLGDGPWRDYALRDRPVSWSRPAACLIIGKAFTLKSQGWPNPDGDNDYSVPGDWSEADMGPLTVTALTADRRRLTPAERKSLDRERRDPDGTRILDQPGEPSFDRVAALYPAMRNGRASTGVPEHPDEVIVYADGRVELGDYSVRPVVDGHVLGADPAGLSRSLTDGWMPIHRLRCRIGDLECEETAFAMSEGGRYDRPLLAYVRLAAANRGAARVAVAMSFALEPAGVPLPSATLGVPVGGTRTLCLELPYSRGPGSILNDATFGARLADARAMWLRWLAPGAHIVVPEARVTDGCKAWLAYNSLNVDYVGGQFCPHDGCKFYEQVYGQTVAVYIEALDQYGFHSEAARYLDTLIALQLPDGQLVSSYPCFFEHGMVLDALCKHYLYTRDRVWLQRAAPAVDAAARFIVTERAKTTRDGAAAGPDMIAGLLPPSRPYCDWPDPTVSLVTDAWCCVGLECAAGVLADAGMAREAASLADDARAYRARIAEVARAAIVQASGMPALKLEPLTGRILAQSGGTARDYYSMYGCGILESRFWPLRDPIADVVANFLERGGGLACGCTSFGGGMDHAYTSGYWLTMLDRGEVRRVLLAFYAMLAYGMTRDTYSGVEVTMYRTGENQPTLPHLASGAHQLRLLRCMLAEEVGDELRLLAGAPRAWLAAPMGLRLSGLCTFFGDVTLSARLTDGHRAIAADVAVTTRRPGRTISVRLPHPDGLRLRSATVDGQMARVFGDAVVFTWRDRASIVAHYGPAQSGGAAHGGRPSPH